jgi:hypothetical protein
VDFRDVALIARASEKYVGGAGEFVKNDSGFPWTKTRQRTQDRPTREPRCCGTASPFRASIVLRRKLLLQTEWLNEFTAVYADFPWLTEMWKSKRFRRC